MKILALDTAGRACSVTLRTEHGLYTRVEAANREHSRHVLNMLDQVLVDGAIKLKDLDLLAWNAGPGSFTGLRIGASVIQALSYSLALPVLSLSSLELLAHAAARSVGRASCNLAVAIDARMNGVYWATFRLDDQCVTRLGDDQLLSLAEIELPWTKGGDAHAWKVAGDAWQLTSLSTAGMNPVALESFAEEVVAQAISTDSQDWLHDAAAVVPCYIGGIANWKKRQLRGQP